MASAFPDLTALVRTQVSSLGFELADLRQAGSPQRAHLQVRIDRPGAGPGSGVTVGDCQAVSRALETWLDASEIVGRNYVLEVSSPGIERPVRWREHWERFVGRDVNVRLPGRGRVRARIVRVVEGEDVVVLRPAGASDDVTVPIPEARDARLAVDWE
jgi:ribosome maturation factor RimP